MADTLITLKLTAKEYRLIRYILEYARHAEFERTNSDLPQGEKRSAKIKLMEIDDTLAGL